MKNLRIHDYLFHYNPYTSKWSAFKREDKEKYFNGELEESKYFRGSDVTKLFNIVLSFK